MRNATRWLAVFVSFTFCWLMFDARLLSAGDTDGPRYDLHVGRVLTYACDYETGDGEKTRETFTATVLATNADGSFRVLLRSVQTSNGAEEVTVGGADVFPDGRSRLVARTTTGSSGVFPPLPHVWPRAGATWQGAANAQGTVVTYTTAAAPADDGQLVFTSTDDGPAGRVYGFHSRDTIRIDLRNGALVKNDGEVSMGGDRKKPDRNAMTLEKDETLPASRAASMAAGYDAMFRADSEWFEVLERIDDAPAEVEHLVKQANELLAAGAKGIQDPDAAKDFERLRKHCEDAGESVINDGRLIQRLLGKPIADWHAKDLAGNTWSRDGLKGKVVVMDLWYRECPWCVFAMPEVKQLAADYKDKGVVTLGMNTDLKDEDAEFVVRALGLDCPLVRATEFARALDIHSFPLFIVIDRDGVVRHVHCGYTPGVRERMSRRIDALLMEKPTTSPAKP